MNYSHSLDLFIYFVLYLFFVILTLISIIDEEVHMQNNLDFMDNIQYLYIF